MGTLNAVSADDGIGEYRRYTERCWKGILLRARGIGGVRTASFDGGVGYGGQERKLELGWYIGNINQS